MMKLEPNEVKVTINYKNNIEAKNKFIEYIIDFLLEQDNLVGDSDIEKRDTNV